MSENITKTIKSFVVTKEELEKRKMEKFDKLFQAATEKLQEGFDELCQVFEQHINDDEKIYIGSKGIYYVPSVAVIMPNESSFLCSLQLSGDSWKFGETWNKVFGNNEFVGVLPSNHEIEELPITWENLDKKCYGYITLDNGIYYAYSGYYDWRSYTYNGWSRTSITNRFFVLGTCRKESDYEDYSNTHIALPIFRLNGVNSDRISAARTLLLFVEYGLEPGGDENTEWFTDNKVIKKAYKELAKVYAENKAYLIGTEDGISLNKKAILNDIRAGKNPACLGFDAVSLFTNDDIEVDEEYLNEIKEQYLSCDYERAAIDKYDAKLLTDINRGHWDLWDYDKQFVDVEIGGNVVVPGGMIARNPWSDVQEGVVAIDFGTKSTVVVYGEGALNNQPLQVGNGNYATEEEKNKYENPTVIRFKDIESFRNAYDCKVGRPLTKWEDVCVSHTAFEDMMKTNEANYNSFMNNLKQWCSNPKFKVKLEDSNKASLDLPNFLDVKAEDLNPVEVYAYYIGSYLNNMLGTPKIYKHYIMSFPVTFDHEIREKILESFKVGLIKSLPVSLVKDEKFMADFSVEEGATEPAAYAATALTELGYDTDEQGDIYYGVFDFGGGTTDFDFGVLREGEGRCANDLIHFGANGDKTLGGENLLRKLAFEVFKFNRNLLRYFDETTQREVKIPFNWDMDYSDFVGSKDYIEDSQAANQNMHNLMERLRPVWENPDSEKAEEITDSNDGFTVSLLDADGNQRPNFTLYLEHVNNEDETEILDLSQIIRDRIEDGVEKFFLAMKEAFAAGIADNEYDISALKDIDTFTIFLAGNSSKAEVVHELFDEYIGDGEDKDVPCKALEILGVEEIPKFVVEEPLGMHSHDYAKPNGKTGVAFGLLICREGGEDIRVIDITPDKNKVPFQYYVGRNRKRKFKTYLTTNSKLNQWVEFIDASANFEIYYTNDPGALDSKASISIAKGMISVKLNKTDEDAKVYIRPIDSRRIEWCVAKTEDDLQSAINETNIIKLE